MFGNEDATDTLTDLMTDEYAVFEKNPNHHDAEGVGIGTLVAWHLGNGPMEDRERETKDGTAS